MIVTSATAPSRSVPRSQFDDLGGAGGHQVDQLHPVDVARLDQRLDVQRQGAFQADDAERGVGEFQFLFLGAMRGVIGGEAVDGAVLDAFDAGGDIGGGAQRRDSS